jgi:hypothetical protein
MAIKEPELDLSIFYRASGCPVSKVKLESPEHQALFEKALTTLSISHSAIVDVIYEKWGVEISKDTMRKHRITPQACSCRSIPK